MKYLKVDDIPYIDNYIALYGAIKSKEEISVKEALSRVGVKMGNDQLGESKEMINGISKNTSSTEKPQKEKYRKATLYRYKAYTINDNLICEGDAKEVAKVLGVTHATVRNVASIGSRLRGYISITKEKIYED